MNKVVISLFLALASLFAAGDSVVNWNYDDTIELKKDELARYNIGIDDKTVTLDFRWTLYVNKGLVMLYTLDMSGFYGEDQNTNKKSRYRFPKQNILYKDHKLDRFKLKLKNRAPNSHEEPYAVVVFKEFNNETKKAVFNVLMRDDFRSIQAERVLPRDN